MQKHQVFLLFLLVFYLGKRLLTTISPNLAYAKLPQLYGRPLLYLWLLKFAQLLFEQRNIDDRRLLMKNPTIVMLTDRNDLDDQLFSTFGHCKQLLRQTPVQAESREHTHLLLWRI
jgi:hypothetical protein